MSNKLSNYFKISALTLFVATSCVALSESPAQAGPFDFLNQINSTVREVNGTVNGIKNTGTETNSAIGNLTDLLGVGKSPAPAAGAAAVDPAAQVNGAYGAWYKGMSPTEKEIANALTSEYAEKGALDFAAFKSSDLFKAAKTSKEKQAASALFFKYAEVVKVVGPQKEKFLAYAFCVNGGSTTCK
jgi:hypothetical protein